MTRRRTIDPAKNRQEICSAAVRVFAELGFHAASYERIAREAGVAKSMVQYHFPSKDELWQEALMDMLKPLLDVMDRHLANGVEMPLERFTVARFRFLQQNPLAPRFLAWVSLNTELVPKAMLQRVSAVLQMAASHLKSDAPEVFLGMLLGAIDGWFRFRPTPAGAPLQFSAEKDELYLRELLIRFFGPEGPARGGLD